MNNLDIDEKIVFNIVNTYLDIGNAKDCGGDWKIRCPFHSPDNDPSFYINKYNGIFYCFGCQIKGNLIQLIMKIKKCTFEEAYKEIGDPDINSKIKHRISNKILHIVDNSSIKELKQEDESNISYIKYKNKEECPKYLLGRLEWETIDHFQLGYTCFEKYKGRIIIPIFRKNHIVGFVARDYMDQDPKYLFPFNFKKSNYIFNDKALEEEIILVEGTFDAMSMWEKGFQNSVAILGHDLSSEQLKILCAFNIKRIVLCLDNDEKKQGNNAMITISKELKYLFPEIYIMDLISKDPADATKIEIEERYNKKRKV